MTLAVEVSAYVVTPEKVKIEVSCHIIKHQEKADVRLTGRIVEVDRASSSSRFQSDSEMLQTCF